jgi:hypothetical protein
MRNGSNLSLVSIVLLAACAAEEEQGFGNEGITDPHGNTVLFGDPNKSALRVEPSNAVLFIDTATNPATAARQAFKVFQATAAGDVDVTAQATFALDQPSIGSFTGSSFQSVTSLPPDPPGVTSKLTVSTGVGVGSGSITVVPLQRSSANRDFFFVVPYREAPSPASDTLRFTTNIQNVDVSFVMDTTGSMGSSINGLKSALAGTLLAQLQAAIPSVGMSIVSHKDETDGNQLVSVRQATTTELALAQAGVNSLTPSGGDDTPEGQIPAMWHVLTGGAVSNIPAAKPLPGTTGAVNFRAGAVPVVVLITDAPWHDSRAGISSAILNLAFNTAHARFVSLAQNDESQANALSDATGSNLPASAFAGCAAGKCCTDIGGAARAPSGPGGTCRLNYRYSNGNNIGGSVVGAIKAIAVGSVYDVTVRPKNDPTNTAGMDATKFIKAMRAKDEGDPAENCPAHPAKDTNGDGIKDTFIAVTVGTRVCFEVIAEMNTTVQGQAQALYPRADLEVLGVPGDIKLDNRKVLFLVPPKSGAATR